MTVDSLDLRALTAERDTLRSVIRKAISAHPLTGADPQGRGCWFRHFTAEDGHPSLAVISLSDAEHDAIRRALDASPTEGNPARTPAERYPGVPGVIAAAAAAYDASPTEGNPDAE